MKTKITIGLFLLFSFINSSFAQNVGEPAPDFTLISLDNGTIQLSNYRGRVVFLYFIGYT